jgi:Zn-finger domain-containing protein
MDNLTLSIEDLFDEISNRARTEGAFSREEWHDTIEEVLEEKREVMEIDDDDDFRYMTESLQARFEQFSHDLARM